MKTFKHRKTGEIATYKDGVLNSSGFSVEIGVEPSSEFWEEVKSPLFKTEDGVDIYEGDSYWFIWVTGNSFPKNQVLNYPYYISHALKLDKDETWSKDAKFFSSKKAAERHILLNKPCLSINDICPIIGQCNETTHINLDKLTTRLENLVKSKHYESYRK